MGLHLFLGDEGSSERVVAAEAVAVGAGKADAVVAGAVEEQRVLVAVSRLAGITLGCDGLHFIFGCD